MVQLRCGMHTADALGIVDSGADGSLLPKSLAPELGLDPTTDLVQSPQSSGGAGGIKFETWTTAQAITGQVVELTPRGRQLWGPTMHFKPVFAEGEQVLFGRSDFFRHFSITFETHITEGPVFHLDCG